MVFGNARITRRDMMGRLMCCGSIVAGPAYAGAATIMRDWNGFTAPPRWQAFSLVTGDTIVLPIDVAAVSAEAILDSGSAASILSPSLAAKLGLSSTERRTIRGVGGRASVQLVRDVEIAFAGELRRAPFVIISDLKAVSAALGRDVDVVLGADVLTGRSIALDFDNCRIAVAESGSFSAGPDWRRVPLSYGANRELLVQASVAGLPSASMVFDLGSSTALMLARAYVEEHRLLEGIKRSTAAIGGVDGIMLATAFMAEMVQLGSFPVPSIPTLTPSSWLSTSAVGSIGFPIISQFDTVLDLSAGQVWLRPAQRGLPILEDHSGFGLALTGSELSIVHVAANSPAAAAGWTVGDRIQALNGRSIDGSYISGKHWRWRFRPAGTRVTLRDQKGHVRELLLADYF